MKYALSLLPLLYFGMLRSVNAQTVPSGGGGPTVPTGGGGPTVPTGGGGPTVPTGEGGSCSGLCNPLKDINNFEDLLQAILQAVVRLGSIVIVIAIVYVGFKFVVSQGNEEKLQEARSALMWTVIGGLILLGAQAISLVIQQTAESIRI